MNGGRGTCRRTAAALAILLPVVARAGEPAFDAAPGAVLEVTRWRFMRTLSVGAAGGLLTVGLAPEDLAVLRSSLDDLRLVDGNGAQVPYLVVAEDGEQPVPLAIEAADAPRGWTSRWRLRLPTAVLAGDGAPPLRAIDLDFADARFTRTARVWAPGHDVLQSPARLRDLLHRTASGPTPLFAGPLRRAPGDAGSLRIALGGLRTTELTLEIDDGDSAPLHLRAARGLIPVFRLVFRAPAGMTIRMLLGNRDAVRPAYDIEAEDRSALAAQAASAAADPLVPNPSFRPRWRDYVAGAPRTLVLWSVLVGAMMVLLGLTVKIVAELGRDHGKSG